MATTQTQTTRAGTATFQIDPAHTVVEFSVKHMMFSTVKGHFAKVSGEIIYDEVDPTQSSVSASVDAASVETRDARRDAHLRSPDFFDVETYPTITFTSKRIERSGDEGSYRLVGDLSIHGVTNEVTLDATHLGEGKDPWGGTRVGFNATTTINRKDYGLHYNAPLEAGGVMVGDQVKISLDVQAVKKS